MRNQQKIKIVGSALAMLAGFSRLNAQQDFLYRANLPQTSSSGFYSIRLQPGFIAKSQGNYADIRLIDDKNTFQPFLFSSDLYTGPTATFSALARVTDNSATSLPGSYTVENTSRLSISSLSLQLRNAAVTRTVNLMGSDNQTTWFAIKDSVVVEPADYNNNNSYEQKISFPATNYRYLKIQLNDNKKTPINIEQVGIYFSTQTRAAYEELTGTSFTQFDSSGVSIVTLTLPEANQVNKLHFTIAGTRFYQRNASVYQVINNQLLPVNDVIVASTGEQDMAITAKATQLKVYIRNGDNPPLQIQSVKAYQQTMALIGYLEKEKHYQLLTGNATATLPNYDLRFFKDSIQRQPSLLEHEAVTDNPLFIKPGSVTKKELPSWLIWLCIGVALTALTFLSVKMTKELGKNKAANK